MHSVQSHMIRELFTMRYVQSGVENAKNRGFHQVKSIRI